MIAVNENGRIVIVTIDEIGAFGYVPKAMVKVLSLAIESIHVESAREQISTYLDFLDQLLPETYEGLELEKLNASVKPYRSEPQAQHNTNAIK